MSSTGGYDPMGGVNPLDRKRRRDERRLRGLLVDILRVLSPCRGNASHRGTGQDCRQHKGNSGSGMPHVCYPSSRCNNKDTPSNVLTPAGDQAANTTGTLADSPSA